ncbi:MAG: FG-GAP repeat protein [Acidobacteriota bacterium]
MNRSIASRIALPVVVIAVLALLLNPSQKLHPTAKAQTARTLSPPNMVSWWPADAKAIDIIGNNGTLQNRATFVTGDPAVEAPATHRARQVPEGLVKSDWASIRAAYEASRHRVSAVETGGHQARNSGQQWRTHFDGRGFLTQPDAGGWQWGLELKHYGFPGQERAIGGQAQVNTAGQRVAYAWDDTLQEWFLNDQRGLEHGFTVKERPTGAPALSSQPSTLNFQLAVRGGLHPVIEPDGGGVRFVDTQGGTVLTYAGLKVWDADGKVLPARFEALDSRHSSVVTLSVDERGARYPLMIDPIAQQAYLKPAAVGTTQARDNFGQSVALSGDTAIVGAPFESSNTTGVNSTRNESAAASGAAYVFTRSAGVWTQQAYLKPAAVGTTQGADNFGFSVAVSGDTVVVGAYLEDSSTTGVNSTPNESAADSGAAYVFTRSAGVWTQQAYLKPATVGTSQAVDLFGISVSISGDTVVVGAQQEDSSTTGVNSTPNESGGESGAAYVFTRNAGVWTQQAYLKPAAVGVTQELDFFGTSVAVAGDTVVVGANGESSSTTGVNSSPDDNALLAGAAYVFTRSAGVWTQQAYLKPAAVGDFQDFENFGLSVAVSGETVVVGAFLENSSTTGVNSPPDDNAQFAGAAYVFTRSGGVWTQQAYLKPAAVGTTQAGDNFGFSVAISGDTVVVGAQQEDSSTTGVNSTANESATDSGAAYVFTRSAGVWTQQAYLKPAAVGTAQIRDNFAIAVAVSGDTVVVGAPFEDSNTTGVNSTPSESATDSGAAYVFTGLAVTPAEAIQNLITTINNMGLPAGVMNSLTAPLGQASNLLNDNNPNNDIAACGKLNAFINQVDAKLQNGQLTSAQVSQLLQAANAIRVSLGC